MSRAFVKDQRFRPIADLPNVVSLIRLRHPRGLSHGRRDRAPATPCRSQRNKQPGDLRAPRANGATGSSAAPQTRSSSRRRVRTGGLRDALTFEREETDALHLCHRRREGRNCSWLRPIPRRSPRHSRQVRRFADPHRRRTILSRGGDELRFPFGEPARAKSENAVITARPGPRYAGRAGLRTRHLSRTREGARSRHSVIAVRGVTRAVAGPRSRPALRPRERRELNATFGSSPVLGGEGSSSARRDVEQENGSSSRLASDPSSPRRGASAGGRRGKLASSRPQVGRR